MIAAPQRLPVPLGPPIVPTRRRRRPREGWGPLEAFLVAQTLIPGILFIPGAGPLRTASRVAVFALSIACWLWAARRRPGPGEGARPFAPHAWLLAGAAWMALSIAHPDTNSLTAGAASTLLTVAVMAPAFWAGRLVDGPDRLRRVVLALLLCHALNVAVGLLQVVSPSAFLPPSLLEPDSLKFLLEYGRAYKAADGSVQVRPCGLTDTPGAASAAGAAAGLLAVCWALRPGRGGRLGRLLGWGVALAGLLAIFFTMVRAALVMQAVCFLALIALFAAQRRFRQAATLAIGAAAVAGAAIVAVAATGAGERVLERFGTLVTDAPAKVYQDNRGHFVRHAFETALWEHPLGGGLGRWGMIYVYFGRKAVEGQTTDYWVEVQWSGWILDGGAVLLLCHGGAMVLAMLSTLGVALGRRTPPEVAYWAAAVFALNLSVVALTFSYVPFASPIGMQFWLLAAATHAAARAGRRRRPRLLRTAL